MYSEEKKQMEEQVHFNALSIHDVHSTTFTV